MNQNAEIQDILNLLEQEIDRQLEESRSTGYCSLIKPIDPEPIKPKNDNETITLVIDLKTLSSPLNFTIYPDINNQPPISTLGDVKITYNPALPNNKIEAEYIPSNGLLGATQIELTVTNNTPSNTTIAVFQSPNN